MVPDGAGAPIPYHQLVEPRQVALSTSLLKTAPMSGFDVSRSAPYREFATACTYHVEASGAPLKSRITEVGPALPRTAEEAVQNWESILAAIWIGTVDLRIPPQYSSAARNTFSRCCPRVVPRLPNTGATKVGSLKPSPAPSRFRMLTVTSAAGGASSMRWSPRGPCTALDVD